MVTLMIKKSCNYPKSPNQSAQKIKKLEIEMKVCMKKGPSNTVILQLRISIYKKRKSKLLLR